MTCVYVSPHLDDAAFSCAAGIVSRRAAGARVVVITVFSEGEPARTLEDRSALSRAGVEAIHLGFDDAPVRLGIAPSFRNLMLDLVPRPETIEAIAAALRERLDALEPRELWWPLGIGGHIDHRTVFEVSRRLSGPHRYYEDRPYAFVPAFARLRRAQLEGGTMTAPPSEAELDAEIDAGGCAAFFGPDERRSCVEALVVRMHRRWAGRGMRVHGTPRRHAGSGPAALSLVESYPSQLRWIVTHSTAQALWRRWGFDEQGEPVEPELRIDPR